jgi:PAS domain S-box-containing protein
MNVGVSKQMYVPDDRFQRLLESNIIGVVVVEEGRVLEANDAFLRVIGRSQMDVQEGKIHWRRITPQEYAHLDELHEIRLIEDGSVVAYEKELLHKDESRVSVLVGAVRLQVSPKLQWISFVLELGDRQRLQKRWLMAERLETLGYLTRALAQRFNNAQMALLNSLSLALESLPDNSPAHTFVEAAAQAANRIVDLSRDLNISSGNGGLVVEPINISMLVQEIENQVRDTLPCGVQLISELATALPLVLADTRLVRELLMNLVSNATQAMGSKDDGTITIRTMSGTIDESMVQHYISYEGIRPGRYVFLQVIDSGHAIDESIRLKIFDPFFSTKDIGRGLGLTIVLGILRSHGGHSRLALR